MIYKDISLTGPLSVILYNNAVIRRSITMLNVTKTIENGSALFALAGRLDTTTAPELEAKVKADLDGVTSLTLDIKELDYISSAGLRVLLSLQKQKHGNRTKMVQLISNCGMVQLLQKLVRRRQTGSLLRSSKKSSESTCFSPLFLHQKAIRKQKSTLLVQQTLCLISSW